MSTVFKKTTTASPHSRIPVSERTVAVGLFALLSFIAVFTATSCAVTSPTDTSSDENPVATNAVSITGHQFSPAVITVTQGTTVTWTHNDSTVPHTVTSTDGTGLLASGTLTGGDTYSQTFGSAGTFTYKCGIHSSMTGKVIVTN